MNEEFKKAWEIAVRLLSRREYAQQELRCRLGQRAVDADITEQVLERLVAAGYQSDARFAEHYTRFRAGKGYGPKRIRLELREKGVEDSIIDDGLQQAAIDWTACISEVWRKKFNSQPADDWQGRSKQSRFLDYRGFTREQIESCLTLDPD